MKIEMVVPALPRAGMEMVVAILVRGLARRGHDVGVTCLHYKGDLGEILESEGHRVTVTPTPGLRTILLPVNLRRWLRQRRPDVVHIHSGAWLKAARAAAMARVPRILFTMHGIDGTQPWYIPLLDRWAARSTHVAVSVSDAFVDYLIARVHVSPDRVAVVTNGVDTAHFRPGTHSGRVRNPYSLSERDVVIGHVARFSPVKNHAMLIEAFAQVLRTHPHAFLALVGDGPLRAATESRVDTLGIRSRVGFLGQFSDLPEIYRDFDILVLPSFTEATSMSILEGMACGLPVVATEVGGSPHLLADGEAGILVASDDAPQLSVALIALIDAPKERARLGQAARHRAEKCYTEDLMLDAYESLYMEGRALDESGVRRISFPTG